MKARDFFDSDKQFRPKHFIKRLITLSESFDSKIEDINKAELLLLFKTSKQQTWLISTSVRLYCVLDDIRRSQPVLAWSRDKSQLFQHDNFILSLEAKSESDEVGTINIGPNDQEWYFTKPLFYNKSVDISIKNFLEKNMLQED